MEDAYSTLLYLLRTIHSHRTTLGEGAVGGDWRNWRIGRPRAGPRLLTPRRLFFLATLCVSGPCRAQRRATTPTVVEYAAPHCAFHRLEIASSPRVPARRVWPSSSVFGPPRRWQTQAFLSLSCPLPPCTCRTTAVLLGPWPMHLRPTQHNFCKYSTIPVRTAHAYNSTSIYHSRHMRAFASTFCIKSCAQHLLHPVICARGPTAAGKSWQL